MSTQELQLDHHHSQRHTCDLGIMMTAVAEIKGDLGKNWILKVYRQSIKRDGVLSSRILEDFKKMCEHYLNTQYT